MSGRWWRAYDEAVDDPKLQMLGLEMIGAWFNLICLASKNKGIIRVALVPFALRISKNKSATIITKLVCAGLLDREGDDYRPHNWEFRQYQSDYSSQRVKNYRQRRTDAGLAQQWYAPKALRQAIFDRDEHQCVYCGAKDRLSIDHKTPVQRGGNDGVDNLQVACRVCNAAKRDMTHDEFIQRNVSETFLKRPQKEQNTETEKKETDSRAVAPATRPKSVEAFSQFWAAYPKRDGANPKAPAEKVFAGLVKSGVDPAEIIEGASRCAQAESTKIGTPYIPQAVKWLRDRRWQDYAAPGTDTQAELLEQHRQACMERTNGAQVRRDTGLGETRPDHAAELRPSDGMVRGDGETLGG